MPGSRRSHCAWLPVFLACRAPKPAFQFEEETGQYMPAIRRMKKNRRESVREYPNLLMDYGGQARLFLIAQRERGFYRRRNKCEGTTKVVP
jgi:hypothetical protein